MGRTTELVLNIIIVLFAITEAALYAIEGSMMVVVILPVIALLNIVALVLLSIGKKK